MTGKQTPPSRRSRPPASPTHRAFPRGSAATRSKYGNRKTTVGRITFASRKEAGRYGQLRLLVAGKVISDLELQPVFPLVVEGIRIGKYIADFSYVEKGRQVVEDVKGGKATQTPVWALKWRFVKALRPDIDWRIV